MKLTSSSLEVRPNIICYGISNKGSLSSYSISSLSINASSFFSLDTNIFTLKRHANSDEDTPGSFHTNVDMDVTNSLHITAGMRIEIDRCSQFVVNVISGEPSIQCQTTQTKLRSPVVETGRTTFANLILNAQGATIESSLRLKRPNGSDDSNGNYGTWLRFGDGDLCYICEPADDYMKLFAGHDITFEGNGNVINKTSTVSTVTNLTMRNIKASTAAPDSTLVNGAIWLQYA